MTRTTYIRSADETHQVRVAYTQKQFGRIWGRLAFGTVHDGLPVLPCPDLDAWLDEQIAVLTARHQAHLAEVRAKLPMTVSFAVAA